MRFCTSVHVLDAICGTQRQLLVTNLDMEQHVVVIVLHSEALQLHQTALATSWHLEQDLCASKAFEIAIAERNTFPETNACLNSYTRLWKQRMFLNLSSATAAFRDEAWCVVHMSHGVSVFQIS